MSTDTVRWGILGPGAIARAFASGLVEAEGCVLDAVGSRDLGRARAFAWEFGAARAHGSYEELAADPDVDAVYVASPHSEHEAHVVLCLEAGKHVLCEKALALNVEQARRMFAAADANDRALTEAMWTRFLPAMIDLRRRIVDGVVGDVRVVHADFGFLASFDPESRLFAPRLGGGALLDIGVYPLNLAWMLCGPPRSVRSTVKIGATGVDEEFALLCRHDMGVTSVHTCSFRADTPRRALVVGTEGSVEIGSPWWGASSFVLRAPDGRAREIRYEHRGGGYTYEAEAFATVIRDGRRDSDHMPRAASLALLELADELRSRWGVRYPCESL